MLYYVYKFLNICGYLGLEEQNEEKNLQREKHGVKIEPEALSPEEKHLKKSSRIGKDRLDENHFSASIGIEFTR